jgi:hypothetical protein
LFVCHLLVPSQIVDLYTGVGTLPLSLDLGGMWSQNATNIVAQKYFRLGVVIYNVPGSFLEVEHTLESILDWNTKKG